jgi:hypothetical protein
MFRFIVNINTDHLLIVQIRIKIQVKQYLHTIRIVCCLGTYYTPQLKRKRVQDQVRCSPVKAKMDTMENLLMEVNRKLDLLQKKEDGFEKKIDAFYKRVRDLFREGNKVILFFLNRDFFLVLCGKDFLRKISNVIQNQHSKSQMIRKKRNQIM